LSRPREDLDQIAFGYYVGQLFEACFAVRGRFAGGLLQQLRKSCGAARQCPIAALAQGIGQIDPHGDAEKHKAAKEDQRKPAGEAQ
jgi:hypothetical protein